MSFLKEHKIQLFLLLAIVVIGIAIASAKEYTRPEAQEPNIFEEIYNEEKETFRTDNILGKIEGFDIKASWPRDSDHDPIYDQENNPHGEYKGKNLPNSYIFVHINFYFNNDSQSFYIDYEKRLDKRISLLTWNRFSYKNKTLSKKIGVFVKNENGSSVRIEDENDVKAYLQEYGITAADLDSYYDEIVNKKVLTDWCSIFDSKFSPDNYGEITIETQWENW